MKTKHIEGKVQSLDIFNKRLDNLIAMRGASGCDSYEVVDDGINIKFCTNGAVVLVSGEASVEGYWEFDLPEKYSPSENVSVCGDGCSGLGVRPSADGKQPYAILAVAFGGATRCPFHFTGAYPVKDICIEELEDARVGYDGTTYETAGTAIRSQVVKMAEDMGRSVVYVDYDSSLERVYTPFAEILEAYEKGKLVVLDDGDGHYCIPMIIHESGAVFGSVRATEIGVEQFLVAVDNEDNTNVVHTKYSADDAIDDTIESAESTWSSRKIVNEIASSANVVTIDLRGEYKKAIADAEEAGYKKAVETFCPQFEKEARLVQVYPLYGYPYAVGQFTNTSLGIIGGVTVCGKNLYNKNAYPLDTNGYPFASESTAKGTFATSHNYRRTGFIPVSHLAGQTIVLSHCPFATNPGMVFYTRIPNVSDSADCKDAWCGGTTGASIKVPDDAEYMVFCVKAEDANADVQIELGSKSTEHEMYSAKTFGSDEEIKLREGCNTIYTLNEGCVVSVKCREDISALVRNMQNYFNMG